MVPEEKMAARVLSNRNLKPPYDLEALAREYGTLEFKSLPFRIDGITIGIGEKAKPRILINSEISDRRQKFTLAHEIGHVVIPWHVGTVVSHLEPGDEDMEYKQMEMEANRFAAELLMPSTWVQERFATTPTFKEFFQDVLRQSGASKDAVFFKILRYLTASAVLARYNENTDEVIGIVKSPTAPNISTHGQWELPKFRGLDFDKEVFQVGGNHYVSWVFQGKDIDDVDPRSWREILNEILAECGLEHKLQSINAILATAFNKSKTHDEAEICGTIIRSFSTRSELRDFHSHPLFEQYVVKRVKELKDRQ